MVVWWCVVGVGGCGVGVLVGVGGCWWVLVGVGGCVGVLVCWLLVVDVDVDVDVTLCWWCVWEEEEGTERWVARQTRAKKRRIASQLFRAVRALWMKLFETSFCCSRTPDARSPRSTNTPNIN